MKAAEFGIFGLTVALGVAAIGFDAPRTKSASAATRASMMRPAVTAYTAGNYANAIELAERALPESPVEALGVIGASSCYLNNASAAGDAATKLDAINPADADFVRTTCASKGVTLTHVATR